MTTLLATTNRYRYAGTPMHHTAIVEDTGFRQFRSVTQALRDSLLRYDQSDEDLRLVRRTFSSYHFRVATAPLPLGSPVLLSDTAKKDLSVAANALRQRYPSLKLPIEQAFTALKSLVKRGDAPLLQPMTDAARGRTALLLPKSSLQSAVREHLAPYPLSKELHVLTPAALRTADTYDRLVLLGCPYWYPQHVFTAPIAAELCIVAYAGLSTSFRISSEFFSGQLPTIASIRRCDADPAADVAGFQYEADEDDDEAQALEAEAARAATDAGEGTTVPARLFQLTDGQAVFLEDSERRTVLTISIDPAGNRRVHQVSATNIEVDSFVLLRTDSSANYIEELANRRLGAQANLIHQRQRDWKDRLNRELGRHGSRGVYQRISGLGGGHVGEVNIERWASAESIAPESEEDFKAVLRMVGLAAQASAYWQSARELRSAHQAAGSIARHSLKQQVDQCDLATLERHGRMDFSLDDVEGCRLTAFRVERVSPRRYPAIARSRIERSFAFG